MLDLEEKILKKESEKIEHKKSTASLKEGVISLAAMLNKNKGEVTLNFGVANDGKIVGQDVSEQTLRRIATEIENQIKPTIRPIINIVTVNNKNYIEVKAKGNKKP